MIYVKGRYVPEFGAFKYYTTDEDGNEIYQSPIDTETGNWNPNYTVETSLNLTPRKNGSGEFKKTYPPISEEDTLIKSFGARGEPPKYFQTKSGLIVQSREVQKKAEQYSTINKLDIDCSTRTQAIDNRLLDIGRNAQKVLESLQAYSTPSEYEAARALFPLVLRLEPTGILSAVTSFATQLNSKEQDQNKAVMIQSFKATLANYEIEAKKLLDLKKGCEGDLSIDDLLPKQGLLNRSAKAIQDNLILILLAILLLYFLYRRYSKS